MKLNQVIAIEKGIKSKFYSLITNMNKKILKADMFNGFERTYKKKDDEGIDYPPESKKVILTYSEIIEEISEGFKELIDITITKDVANCSAFANIVVDGVTILENIPATFLIFLEKQLIDIRTYINDIPLLDENETWTIDENLDLHKSKITYTQKTKKTPKPIILYPATDKFPAQTQLINEDMIVGDWETEKLSGAIPKSHKKELLIKVNKLLEATKIAREEANNTDIQKIHIGNKIFEYLFK